MMIRYKFATLILFIFSSFGVAQSSTGEAKGCVEYQSNEVSGRRILFFNETESLFVQSSTKLGAGERESGAKIEDGGIKMTVNVKDEDGNQYYRNFEEMSLTIRHAKASLPAYTYKDDWLTQDWAIKNKTREIGGMQVKKAVTEFRGNTFEVWFAPEVNLPYGPWKLFGLPGLIVEARDQKTGRMDYQLQSLHIPCPVAWPLETPTAAETKTLREHVDYRDNYSDHIHQHLISRLPPAAAARLSPMRSNAKSPRENNLEKIYAWETKEPTWDNK